MRTTTHTSLRNMDMKNHFNIKLVFALLIVLLNTARCSEDYPIDEDGLLITTRTSCYVSNFELLGTDFVTVRT